MEEHPGSVDLYLVLIIVVGICFLINKPGGSAALGQMIIARYGAAAVPGCGADPALGRNIIVMFLLIIEVDGDIMCGQVDTDLHPPLTDPGSKGFEEILTKPSCLGEVVFILLGTPA